LDGVVTVPIGDVRKMVAATEELLKDPLLVDRRTASQDQARRIFDRDTVLGELTAALLS
jgi:hypothetical protein